MLSRSIATSTPDTTGLNNIPGDSPCETITNQHLEATVAAPNPVALIFRIEPPPECVYDSYKEAELALDAWTKANNYNVSKRPASYFLQNSN
ncbi:hypothetical protein PC116_g20456 [Phytophthora cactorum]|uniref:Uncharacterized protein n=1 Tax=Phytophthora cactorum TaxID=29920 RepID=A0A8T1AST5_9STRA|nr:hypothetical protein Pcac1_g28351 [Phytophthora cactorum]KAG2798927.1 hypothetical protein PC111_g20639 [Phytophthora cactorum]KAG2799090.1 hypothetical protein PC112_g21069 [Phytophthora cactorum]KAG2830339.1 hypothetical protein PC113_g21124 [Phytophthora cactorum]KAG2878073.1 hypothetical protein PC114_g23305 [Phytophthora cactorum]